MQKAMKMGSIEDFLDCTRFERLLNWLLIFLIDLGSFAIICKTDEKLEEQILAKISKPVFSYSALICLEALK